MEILSLILIIAIFLFSVVIHEVAHGEVAYYMGDPTAKYAGRLTLNPIKHLDPVGSIIVPGFLILASMATGVGLIFGWARAISATKNTEPRKSGLPVLWRIFLWR
jgi:Zn-dependent protease